MSDLRKAVSAVNTAYSRERFLGELCDTYDDDWLLEEQDINQLHWWEKCIEDDWVLVLAAFMKWVHSG